MRRTAWVLMLGFFAGCGNATKTTAVVEQTGRPEAVIPEEVAYLFDRGDHAEAVEKLTALIEKSPGDANLYSLRSTAYHQIGRFAEAIADLNLAIERNDRDAKLFNNRGFIRLGLEQFDAALDDFNRATQLSEKFINAHNNRGLLFIATQRFEEAITQFDRAIEINPHYVDAYNNRGFAELEAGRIEQALDDFNVALRLDGKYVNAYNNRGLLRARAGDFENAIVDFTQAMMLDPLNPKYYQHRGEVYLRKGSVDKAIADEKKLVWLVQLHQLTVGVNGSTRPVLELTHRASHYLQINDLENALADLNRAVSLDPRSAAALSARADVHYRKKMIEEAKSDAETSLAIEPSHEAFSVLGDVFLKLGDYDRAIENFARARRVDSSVAEAYFAKSRELTEKGDLEQAQNSLQQALVLDPDVESRLR